MIRKSIIMLILFIISSSAVFAQDIGEYFDIEGLREQGYDWECKQSNISESSGHIRLFQGYWLMNFLHWRPLTKEIENINPAYVRHQLLNFWGPNMAYFKLNGLEGDLMINGHRAYFVDGTYFNIVETRFIIWNCPETGRQFTADLNINTAMNTPIVLHEIQQLITNTISCHGEPHLSGNIIFPSLYNSEELGVSFYKPENWRTNIYNSEEWFPEGPQENNATLWTLLTDSEKYVELIWKETEEELSMEMAEEFIKDIKGQRPVKDDSTKIVDMIFENPEKQDNEIVFEGRMTYGTYRERLKSESEEFLLKGKIWRYNGKVYLLLASIVNRNSMWNQPVDLRPSPSRIEQFFHKEIMPFIKVRLNQK